MVPPSLLIGAPGTLCSALPIDALGEFCRLSKGPGVLIPKTELGTSRLELLVVIPRVSSLISPCSFKILANGCCGLRFLLLSLLPTGIAFLLYSATGTRSSMPSTTKLLAAIPGTMKFMFSSLTQPTQRPLRGSPSMKNTTTVDPTSGGTIQKP